MSLLLVCAPLCARQTARHAADWDGAEPTIRVGLQAGVSAVDVSAYGGVVVEESDESTIDWRVSNEVRIEARSGLLRVANGPPGSHRRLSFRAARRGEYVRVNGAPYRGSIDIAAGDAGLEVVNVAKLEDYLVSVVAAELSSRAERDMSALQAQAIVSRTYALKKVGRAAERGFDVVATVSDQLYPGVLAETGAARRAVSSTRGQVLVYNHQLISAFFHSTCGPVTASAEEAFATVSPQPYLQPVSDRRPTGGFYNDISPHFEWRVTWRGDELRSVLRRTLPAVLGIDAVVVDTIRRIYVRQSGPSGRVLEVRIGVGQGEIPVFGPDVRLVFEAPDGEPLQSTAFTLHEVLQNGRVTSLIAEGSGLGHGVGMCQWGAIGRARAGQDYRSIVRAYFEGVAVERWY